MENVASLREEIDCESTRQRYDKHNQKPPKRVSAAIRTPLLTVVITLSAVLLAKTYSDRLHRRRVAHIPSHLHDDPLFHPL